MSTTPAQIALQDGPQKKAGQSTATVIFYGGAKGGGKSRWLVHESAKHHAVPGYGAVLFRRTFGELKGIGSIWEECKLIYPKLGAELTDSSLTARFPIGSSVQLSHLQHDTDTEKWKGKSLPAIGFDELTHFTEQQFWDLFSCLRTTCGTRPRLRATMNPDPDSWVLKFVGWYLDDAGFAIEERSGVVRWFGRIDGRLVWFNSEAEAQAGGVESPTSFTFICAKVFDNTALMKADPTYLAKLRGLPPVEQARFLNGNWRIRAQSGDYFQEPWFPRLPRNIFDRRTTGMPDQQSVTRWFRVWDLAATPVEGDLVIGAPRATRVTGEDMRADADWTRGGLFGELPDGRLIWADTKSWRDTPGAIEWAIKRTAERDGPHVMVVLYQDPAQAGVYQIAAYEKLLRGIARVAFCLPMNPLSTAGLASRKVNRGEVLVPEDAPWFEENIRELESFPNGTHDDAVSMLGLAVIYQLEVPGAGKGHVHDVAQNAEQALEAHWTERYQRKYERNDMRLQVGRFKIR